MVKIFINFLMFLALYALYKIQLFKLRLFLRQPFSEFHEFHPKFCKIFGKVSLGKFVQENLFVFTMLLLHQIAHNRKYFKV